MQLDLFDISGRYAVVTGANRGLGLGIAEGFAKAGANLVLISRTMPEEVLEKLRAYGVEVANFHCDFSQPQTIAPLVKDILARYPKIDILVNAAGTQRRNACVDFTDEDWDFVHAVNEKSPFILCREFGRHMVANHYGKIINFAPSCPIRAACACLPTRPARALSCSSPRVLQTSGPRTTSTASSPATMRPR